MNIERLLEARAPAATLLVRMAVALVFVPEGIQKFIYVDAQGAGRFTRIGIPAAQWMAPFVGVVEISCGLFVLAGLCTRLVAVPLVIDMIVAIASTKLPIVIGHGYWIFAHTLAPKAGVWAFLHESRTDLSMLFCCTFLAIVGAGAWSADGRILRKLARSSSGIAK